MDARTPPAKAGAVKATKKARKGGAGAKGFNGSKGFKKTVKGLAEIKQSSLAAKEAMEGGASSKKSATGKSKTKATGGLKVSLRTVELGMQDMPLTMNDFLSTPKAKSGAKPGAKRGKAKRG